MWICVRKLKKLEKPWWKRCRLSQIKYVSYSASAISGLKDTRIQYYKSGDFRNSDKYHGLTNTANASKVQVNFSGINILTESQAIVFSGSKKLSDTGISTSVISLVSVPGKLI
jgi:hypothetical protein